MTLSDLPVADGSLGAGSIEIIVNRYVATGKAYLFADGKMVIRDLDDPIAQIVHVPDTLAQALGAFASQFPRLDLTVRVVE